MTWVENSNVFSMFTQLERHILRRSRIGVSLVEIGNLRIHSGVVGVVLGSDKAVSKVGKV